LVQVALTAQLFSALSLHSLMSSQKEPLPLKPVSQLQIKEPSVS
jgi:hypothetical protein